MNRQKTWSHRLSASKDTDFTVESRNEAYKNSSIYNDIYEILGGYKHLRLQVFLGSSPAVPYYLRQWPYVVSCFAAYNITVPVFCCRKVTPR